jgi:UrcA family protein
MIMNARSRLNLKPLTLSVLCATACLASSATVLARNADTNDVPRVTVYYGDLNLQRPASVASLYRRIERAAKRVCARPNAIELRQVYAARKCTEEAIDRAVISINMPTLAQYAGASASAG